MTRRKRRGRDGIHPFIAWWQQLMSAFRHVITKGASTKRRAVRKAQAEPEKCPTCRQPIPHSAEWQHHYHL